MQKEKNYSFSKGDPNHIISIPERNSYLKRIAKNIFSGCKKVLIVPPDTTRLYSGAGEITNFFYQHHSDEIHFDVIPALGTHSPMTKSELQRMFGSQIPLKNFLVHNWRKDLIYYGQIPREKMLELSRGLLDDAVEVLLSQYLKLGNYDLILSIGQVVPHEVIGMANYTKNIIIGLGGEDIIHKSHFLGAIYGIEKIIGQIQNPVRSMINFAFREHLSNLPISFLYTVIKKENEKHHLKGLFYGRDDDSFIQASTLSQKCNLNLLLKPIKKAVVYLSSTQFKSTWIGNKAIYRLRSAMAIDGELFILAPGLNQFGEDKKIDQLIKKYGYWGKNHILEKTKNDPLLQKNLSVVAHLIHGSSEKGEFKITYCPGSKISKKEIETVGFNYLSYEKAKKRFKLDQLSEGYNEVKNEGEVFFVSNPALGLWALKKNFL